MKNTSRRKGKSDNGCLWVFVLVLFVWVMTISERLKTEQEKRERMTFPLKSNPLEGQR